MSAVRSDGWTESGGHGTQTDGDAEQSVVDVKQLVDNTKLLVYNTEQLVDNAKQPVDNAKRSVDNAKQSVENAEHLVDIAKRLVDNTEWSVDNAKQLAVDVKQLVDNVKQSVNNAKQSVDDAKRLVDDRGRSTPLTKMCCVISWFLGWIIVPCWAFRWPYRYVNEGQQGLVLEYGKAKPKVIHPGRVKFVNPINSRMRIINMTESLIEIPQRRYLLRNGNLEMGVVICYKVSNAEKLIAFFEGIESIVRSRTAQRLEEKLANQSAHWAQTVTHSTILPDLSLDMESFGVKIVWLEFKDFNIVNFPARPAHRRAQTN
ncbi:unnamed protein product [Penicillium pancosmium]